ncbi:hypothetical protein LTR08_001899 [Meristemomyces frigidus]|nr:hypothetical protein LTR08_001899 [Meristemomyces frigidus]
MSQDTSLRRAHLRRLVERPASEVPPQALHEQLNTNRGASEIDLQAVYEHAHAQMKTQLEEYTKALEASLTAVKKDVDLRVESLGWDGEDGGPGTQGLKDKIEELVKQRWAVEAMAKKTEEGFKVGGG